ncbi:PEP-CTERM sorting domain-containing protein [Telluria aromaticivorans]|nr:PEP-CTERM sorting domain-containing protein [Telluria aromaticivorans]
MWTQPVLFGTAPCAVGRHGLPVQLRGWDGGDGCTAPEGEFRRRGERKVGGLLSRTLASSAISPVPEPQTHALALGGLGVMGAMARRRNKQAA